MREEVIEGIFWGIYFYEHRKNWREEFFGGEDGRTSKEIVIERMDERKACFVYN